MVDKQRRGKPAPDRARKRAIRARAAEAGVPYSVAARQLDAASAPVGPNVEELRANEGRTIYPPGADTHRQRLIESRQRRTADQRLDDTRRAADLPFGRARHLVERFPPSRGLDGTGVGPLYSGDGREDGLALLYRVVAAESPQLVPAVGDLAWIAEMGEETAVDTACAALDRAARLLLDDDEPLAPGLPTEGMRHILDAVLVVSEDGHAAGTRVRMLAEPLAGRTGTIIGARWGSHGPPTGYRVHVDGTPPRIFVAAHDLVVLAGQAPF